MKNSFRRIFNTFLFVVLTSISYERGDAQASATAQRALIPSAFFAVGAVPTGLLNNHDVSLTGGVDLAFHLQSALRPSFEVRGSLPIVHGNLSNEKNVLAGFKLSYMRRISPYATILYGFGQLHYSPYLSNPQDTVGYTYSSSGVISAGGGVSVAVSSSFSVRADAQFQRYSVPVTESHHLYTRPFMVGIEFTPALRGNR